jgi:hypothetical protein
MPTTPLGLVYPASTDNVQLWTHLQLLAESVDTAVTADRARLAAIEGNLIDAVKITTNPFFAFAGAGAEVDVAAPRLSGTLVAGAAYVIIGQAIYATSDGTSEFQVRFRTTTATSGPHLGSVRLGKTPAGGAGINVAWAIPFIAAGSGATTIYASLLRTSGAGNVQLESGGSSPSTVAFNTLVKVGTGGTLRTA